jgi:cytochrome c551/c552
MRSLSLIALVHLALPALAVDFVREVRPILEKHCYECHGPDKQKNGYRLDIKTVAFTGGEGHAPNLIAGKSGESPLFRFVSGADKDLAMPPKSKLSDAEIATLKRWIDEGAMWPDGVDVAKVEDRLDWWSFKPLSVGQRAKSEGIDGFIRAKLTEKGLQPSPMADARTLIRRLYFDLIGLPPSPEEVLAFEAELRSETSAYERLVDRLLASPRYGERWARHWLDLVHFGETHGYDKDKPRNNAWPYRDYVIRALNNDKPYARFVEEQIAGDVLYPSTTDGITALGFIAAGPWDLIGHMEVPETKLDGKIARHLDRDDMVQNAMGTFCSLTVQCAQCHYHKFDPISQEDYYSLQAVFAAVDRTDVSYYPDDASMQSFMSLDQQRKVVATAIKALEEPLKTKAGAAYAALSKRIDGAADKTSTANPNAKPDFGYHSVISTDQNATKWVQVDLGRSVEIQRIVLKPCYDDFGGIGGGFGFPVRFKIEASDDPTFKTGVTLLWRKHDATFMNDFANPGVTPFETNTAGDDGIKGRHVRVTAVKLAPRKNDYIFALAEMQVFESKEDKNLAEGRPVTALDSIEAPPRWRKVNLTDGIAPEARTLEDKQKLIRERDALMLAQADASTRSQLLAARQQRSALEAQIAKLPALGKVYAGAVHTGSGAFKGTGNEGGKPRVIQVLKRGDIKQPAKEVGPGAVQALSQALNLRFHPNGELESDRRAALAKWITDKNNALTWRSIVNRVWQHHFGKGLVDTANDFGRMGGQPSHPELLDWLAATFRDDFGGSLKKLHKLIVMSETYRRSSQGQRAEGKESENSREASGPKPLALSSQLDASNVFLSHQNRRKLDAESIRDSILAVSGKLDLTMGGPSFQDFVIDKPQHSPHYKYDRHDPDDPKSHRRSIYRFIVRSQQQPFMTVLDCADPSMRVDKRNESLSPLQALAMMNNGLTVAMAKHFAARVQKEAGGLEAQTKRAFALALSRDPTADELAPLLDYAKREGLENTCRVIMNLNEFSFVD